LIRKNKNPAHPNFFNQFGQGFCTQQDKRFIAFLDAPARIYRHHQAFSMLSFSEKQKLNTILLTFS
jgi:hypothetical protein